MPTSTPTSTPTSASTSDGLHLPAQGLQDETLAAALQSGRRRALEARTRLAALSEAEASQVGGAMRSTSGDLGDRWPSGVVPPFKPLVPEL